MSRRHRNGSYDRERRELERQQPPPPPPPPVDQYTPAPPRVHPTYRSDSSSRRHGSISRPSRLPGSSHAVTRTPAVRSTSTRIRKAESSGSAARNAVAMGVATGAIGAGYGPYAYDPHAQHPNPTSAQPQPPIGYPASSNYNNPNYGNGGGGYYYDQQQQYPQLPPSSNDHGNWNTTNNTTNNTGPTQMPIPQPQPGYGYNYNAAPPNGYNGYYDYDYAAAAAPPPPGPAAVIPTDYGYAYPQGYHAPISPPASPPRIPLHRRQSSIAIPTGAGASNTIPVPPPVPPLPPTANTNANANAIAREKEKEDAYQDDDDLHNPASPHSFTIFSLRGWMNVSGLLVLLAGLITLFIGFPIIIHIRSAHPPNNGFNVGGINGTGQIPVLPGLPSLIDSTTPKSAWTRTGTDGKTYNLVFSDEFSVDGRTFNSGEDPFWEAQDLYYWPTVDLEWYDPSAITTKNGKLVITMSEVQNHDLNFMSGMLTSWNKLCFTTGYIEVSISLPGSPQAPGLWPAAWTMGNLGRAGYGASTEGMWPYTYDSCDVGTFPGQVTKSGTPASSKGLSGLPGQRLSACTCPNSDHPGPTTSTGRGVPEVDIIEAQVDTSRFVGKASQSFQVAPYSFQEQFVNTTPAVTFYNDNITVFNTYKGGPLQQAVSALTDIGAGAYVGAGGGFATYGYELWSDPNKREEGYVTWFSGGQKSWTATAASVGPDDASGVGQRLISEEPMYVILNLGMAPGFQRQDFKHMQFPAQMLVDYVRIYQRQGTKNGLTCDPPSRPTADYIANHIQAYSNPNLTTWASAGYTFPRNSEYDGC